MEKFKLINSGDPIVDEDIERLERRLGYNFPADFRRLYLVSNGGEPTKEFWAEDDGFEPIRVEDFKYIAPAGTSDAEDSKYIGGCFDFLLKKNVTPPSLIPFAVDEAGNLICLERFRGQVVYFAVDVFQPDIDMHVNHVNAQRVLSSSFEKFIESLVDEGEVDF